MMNASLMQVAMIFVTERGDPKRLVTTPGRAKLETATVLTHRLVIHEASELCEKKFDDGEHEDVEYDEDQS